MLPSALFNPLTLTDIEVTRLDITFDYFRLRDSELLEQLCVLLRKETAFYGTFNDFVLDALTTLIVPS